MAMVEYIGVLSIKLIGGTDLVAMDLNGKSDPFVVFRLGEQKAKSTVSLTPFSMLRWGVYSEA